MDEQHRIGADAFGVVMRLLGGLALAVAIGGAVVLIVRANGGPEPSGVDIAAEYGPGVLLLEPADVTGPDPFTGPVAVDLEIDQVLLAPQPLDPATFGEPHRRGSDADLMVAGEYGWALVGARDSGGGRVSITDIRDLTAVVLGPGATLGDLDDGDGDGFDDDGAFTLQASDGSAACVQPGSKRTLALALGVQIDAEDDAAANGLTWSPDGPCGSVAGSLPASSARTGATPGVFGAAGDGEVCDQGLLASSLRSNAPAAEGWATAHGITPEEIDDLVGDSTPVVLLEDTMVTSFGWRNGAIVSRQSILQRGTAVLVDRRGLPVARCLSGSPLRSPQPLPAAPTYRGAAWPGFVRAFVQEIPAADREVLEFLLVDIVTGEPIRRVPGIGGAAASLAGPLYVVQG